LRAAFLQQLAATLADVVEPTPNTPWKVLMDG
jgi:hypothetical protein